MKAVLTRVSRASVTVDGAVVGAIEAADTCGILALVGAGREETEESVSKMVDKIANLRILPDETSAAQVGAPVLVVSQFTIMGRTARGRRPSWSDAAPGDVAQPIIERIVSGLRDAGLEVQQGRFGAHMEVESVNDGPFTVLVDT